MATRISPEPPDVENPQYWPAWKVVIVAIFMFAFFIGFAFFARAPS